MPSPQQTKHDILGRRSRFFRQPSGKRIVLSDRDIEIFRLLWRYRYLPSDRIASRLSSNSSKRLIERLGDLYHETHHLNRPQAQWRRAKAEQHPLVYELTKLGLEAYTEAELSLILPHPIVNFGGAIDRKILQFDHALQISEVLFDIEQLIESSETRQLMVERDILEKASAKLNRNIEHTKLNVIIPKSKLMPLQRTAHKTWIIPDALFGIEHTDGGNSTYRFYALEVERQNPLRRRSIEKPSTLKKLLAYQALLKSNTLRKQLSLPNLFLIIAATTPTQILKIMELAEQVWSEEERKFLLFAPPVEFRQDTQSSLVSSSPFEKITEKWFEHFQL